MRPLGKVITYATAAFVAAPVVYIDQPARADVRYEYDSAGRLVKAYYSNGTVVEYVYDAAGNRRSITRSGGTYPSSPPSLPPLPPPPPPPAPPPPPPPPGNNPPDAVNDSYYVTGSGSSSLTLYVRNNDTDPDGDPLTITAVTQPGNGAVVAIQGGTHLSATGVPYGTTTFTYTISDGKGGTDTATVTITREWDECQRGCN